MIYRHGDIIIKSVDKIKGKKLKHNGSFVLAEAMSWRFQITQDQWREMVPLVHES